MIAEALRLLRTYHKIKQSQLAAELGISRSYLCEIESGRKAISLDLLKAYSTHFQVPISALFFFSEELDRSRPAARVQGAVALTALRLLSRIALGVADDTETTEAVSN
jgi:transcriptional regulator with XRE-family HTH domain